MEWLYRIAFWHWIIVGILLVILEMIAPGAIVFLWMGLSALIMGIVLLIVPSLHPIAQISIFVVFSIASVILVKRYQDKHARPSERPFLNRRGEQYIGKVFVLDGPIENGTGRMHVEDTTWKVSGEDMPAATRVKVIAVEGTTLKVEALKD